MLILHAAVERGRFLLWGESPLVESASLKTEKLRTAKTNGVARLPFDSGAENLLNVCSEVAPDLQMDDAKVVRASVWLPSVAGQPFASHPLIAALPEAKEKAQLGAWNISALALTSRQVLELLCVCVGRETFGKGVLIGTDLAYWTKVLQFSAALVVRQQFLPDVDLKDSQPRALWRPGFSGADTNRLTLLSRNMPHACRAVVTTQETSEPPTTAAITVLSSFITELTDEIVRSSNVNTRFVKAIKTKRKEKTAFDSVHDQWLHALSADDSSLSLSTEELKQLATQIEEWKRPISISTATPFRLCFRLEEPNVEEDEAQSRRAKKSSVNWTVRYLLQAADDPSLLIPLTEAWQPKGKHAALLRRDSFKAREYLLSSLGRVASFNSRVEKSLKSSAPGGYETDATGAFEFLQEQAWMLEQAGFGVILPAWWTRKGTKLKLSAKAKVSTPKFQGGSLLSLENLVEFNWEIALGNEKLSLKELEALARLKEPLVRWRGQWVQLNSEEIQAALKFWKERVTDKMKARDLVRLALGAERAPNGLNLSGVEASGWIGDLLDQLQSGKGFAELTTPDEFQGTLRPYQVSGFSWLSFLKQWGFGACLADDMGLGKTIQTLALLQLDWRDTNEKEKRPVLLVCPMSVVGNWQKEAEKFTPDLPVMVHHGLTRTKGKAFIKQAKQNAIVLSSYALLHRDFEILKDVDWAGVILDEAQNIKNAQTKQAQTARNLSSDYRIALTGTPVENNVGDLWALMEFLNPTFLGNQTEFKRNFFVPIQMNRDEDASRRLKQLTGPFILRRLKTDKSIIADLPDKMEMKVFCNLTKEQASLYEAVVRDAAKDLDDSNGIQRKGIVLATLMKLKQVCNHPTQFLGDNSPLPNRSGKLSRLTEMLEEVLSENERALVFTQFAEMGELIKKHLQETFGREVLFLHGSVPKKKRDTMVTRFQNEADGPKVFLLSLKAGGTGLNLTAANHVFHFDRWWNPAVENQATDRAFRIGQTKNVQVHKFLCTGTLEERIDEMIERKLAVAESIVGAGEGWLTELSTDELKKLFALSRDAVGE